MGKDGNIVHQYFKKVFEEATILVRVNPIHFKGTEITILPGGQIETRDLEFDADIEEDLKIDGFQEASALEFNLYLSGLTRKE